ncbi:MAG: hypothetical protein Q4C89_00630 [Deinococcus sp.]|uniref:hypothetical protein n=1 Tax=Deinococcus sp. TaxID=47478 RepID=UPI0026DD8402|nr:hypothetical protein [Deinococcus sp.]MDO4244514.1 hypothetical protein [Deinococcus sp.]
MRSLWLLPLLLASTASAEVSLELQQLDVLATQQAKLRLIVYSPNTVTLNGFRGDTVPCPIFKVYDKAGGPPLTQRYLAADCDTGEKVTFRAGKSRVFNVTLPMKLNPGAYTAILTLRTQPPLYATATVNVGPGPFVTELVFSKAKAGQPLQMQVASRNIWRSTVERDMRLCGAGLLIRNGNGKVVYDNKPEGGACTSDYRPTLVPSGGVHLEPWRGKLPALPAGNYTALMWQVGESVMKWFTVK